MDVKLHKSKYEGVNNACTLYAVDALIQCDMKENFEREIREKNLDIEIPDLNEYGFWNIQRYSPCTIANGNPKELDDTTFKGKILRIKNENGHSHSVIIMKHNEEEGTITVRDQRGERDVSKEQLLDMWGSFGYQYASCDVDGCSKKEVLCTKEEEE
jgi:hypothetical protein